MKQFIFSVVVVAVGLGVSLAPPSSEAANPSAAAEHDMRTGTFQGNWCNFVAQFEITSKSKDSWDFEGKILIKSTGQYDRVTVRQYADNHLRIVRHLSGKETGRTQWVDTYPPQTVLRNGRYYVLFTVRSAGGIGSSPQGHLLMPKR